MLSKTHALDTFFCKKLLIEMVYTLSESILDIERFKKVSPEGYVPESNLAAIKCIYSLLEKTHQNEFYFKNTIFNHFVTDKNIKNCTYPSIQNEIPVAASITDLIVTEKGKPSEVLEIKSECDSFDRLASQLPDYYTMFRKVSLVTGEKLFNKANKLPSFKDSPETYYSDLCKLFEALDIQTIIKHVDEVMSQRFYRVKDLIKIPKELRSIYYFGKLTRIERVRVLNFLKK